MLKSMNDVSGHDINRLARHLAFEIGDEHNKFCAKPGEYSGREFFIEEAPHYLKKFGKYIVCERYYDYGVNGVCHELMEARIVPFNDCGAANMFILQLIDSLNYDDESDWSWSRKFVREVVAQAPVEQMLIEEEKERIRREEQRKIEQAKAEKARREAEKRAHQAEKERKAAERAKLERGLREGFRVYIFGFEHDIIKIGMSNNVIKRKSEVQGGLAVVKICCTDKLTSGDARHFEKLCHEHFDDRRKKNVSGREYFEHVPYDEACDYLRSLVGSELINIDSEVES